jgi:glycosyltransferase involved in cell wall biosynthesis
LDLESGANAGLVSQVTKTVVAERAAADVILAPSDFVIDHLISTGVSRNRIVKVPFGAELSPDRLPRPRTPFTALFVGRVSAHKGVVDLLEAWARLDRRPARLVIVGALTDEATAWAKAAPIGVEFRGHLTGLDLEEAYADADVFVFPSRAEGSARVVYEAMAAGLPVVTSRQAGSVVTHGVDGTVIEAGHRDGLVAALQRHFDKPDEVACLGARARQTIQARFTWAEYRRRVADLYRDVAARLGQR